MLKLFLIKLEFKENKYIVYLTINKIKKKWI